MEFFPRKVRLLGRFINTFIVFFPLLLLLLSRSEFREIKGEGEERLLAKLASATKVLRLSLSPPTSFSTPSLSLRSTFDVRRKSSRWKSSSVSRFFHSFFRSPVARGTARSVFQLIRASSFFFFVFQFYFIFILFILFFWMVNFALPFLFIYLKLGCGKLSKNILKF